ncbi:MAG: exosortase E/protease, VPEID-CTERM system [Hyphomicrobium sp.]|uniref:exosortase E/protease, VPEID-CTERM system n=1 Tax=Hyphomicrobium sp. TaxID=82 RepID=UPI0039E31E98
MMRAVSRPFAAGARINSLLALAAIEFLATRLFAPLPDVWDLWPVVGVAHAIPKIFLLSLAIFAVLSWQRRAEIFAAFCQETNDRETLAAAATSASAVLIALLARSLLAEGNPVDVDAVAYIYSAAILVAFTSFVLVAAPLSFWDAVSKFSSTELWLSPVLGALGFAAGSILDRERGSILSEDTWAQLSDVTLQLSYFILKLFDPGAFMDPATRVLGAENFSVKIYAACSGYEGMLLIAAFLVGYMIVFRRTLKFPNVLVLFPMAMGAIWLLNSLRIALLVFIGTHFSPDVALNGFHSQFGWISFLLVAITIMTLAQRTNFFGTEASVDREPTHHAVTARNTAEPNPALLYLAPFIALMAGQIATRIAAPHDFLLYPVKVIAVGLALYALRNVYKRMFRAAAWSSVWLGAVAGIFWIATDPGAGAPTPLAVSLSTLTPLALASWLVFRAIGTILMVPIAEELAFRGYLYRALQSSRFENVDFRAFSLVAMVVSSALFGLMHDRWLAAALAGALYALLMLRRGRIEDAIAAHMTTNAVIFFWAVAAGQWSLL